MKSIGLTSAKMYYWLKKKKCQNSIFQLCQLRHPHQLLSTEVNTIKNYLLNDKFENWSALSIYYQALRDKAVFYGSKHLVSVYQSDRSQKGILQTESQKGNWNQSINTI